MSFVVRPDSAPEWAQDLPTGWRSDWLKWSVGFASTKPEDPEEGDEDRAEDRLPYISNEDIESWTGKLLVDQPEPADKDGRLFQRGDVLFNKLRPYLAKVYLAHFDGISSGELLNLRASERVLPRFLFHLLSSSAFIDTINAETFGTKMPRADWETVGHQPLPLPDLDTQRRIAGFLDERTARIDALIEKKRALLDRLAEKRQALITRAVTQGLNPAAPMKDSDIGWLGKVPAHWEVKRLKYISPKVTVGIVVTPANWYAEEGILALRGLNIRPMGFDLQEARLISEEGHEFNAKSELQTGDLVSVRTGDPGTTAVINEDLAGSNCVDLVIIRRPETMLPNYLGWFLNSDSAKVQYQLGSEGALQSHFNVQTSKETVITVPPVGEQLEIVERLENALRAHDVVAGKISESVDRLTEYRAALLTAAVTGKIAALLAAEAPKPAQKQAPAAFKRAVLAAHIADTLCDHPSFGRVKFQKLLHLCEAHLGLEEVAGHYHRDAAGPFDTQMMQSVHSQIEKPGWFTIEKREGNKGTLYRRGPQVDAYKPHFDRSFGDRRQAIDELLALIGPMSTQQAEIVSTTFAAWNDLLLEGRTPSDAQIVDLILNDWTDSKRQITPDRWHAALGWMREKGLVPRGVGEHTKKKASE